MKVVSCEAAQANMQRVRAEERFLAGEPVLASPTSHSRMMAGKIERHVHELAVWKQDEILSEYEFDSFRKLYDRPIEREDTDAGRVISNDRWCDASAHGTDNLDGRSSALAQVGRYRQISALISSDKQ